jgi:hypothetical protein
MHPLHLMQAVRLKQLRVRQMPPMLSLGGGLESWEHLPS